MTIQEMLDEINGILGSSDPLTEDQETNVRSLQDKVDAELRRLESKQKTEELAIRAKAPATSPPLDTTPEPNPLLPADNPPADSFTTAAYATRFTDVPPAIRSILSELHGSDYEDKYFVQSRAFNRYLRHGDVSLDQKERKVLSELIFTPAAIRTVIEQGADDIVALRATMVEAIDTLGGYIVPIDFQNRIIQRLMGYTVMRGRANVMNTSSNRLEIPVATGGDDQFATNVRVTWVEETPTAGTSETNLTFGSEGLPIHTVMAEVPLSRNVVEDAAFNLSSYLAQQLAEAAAIDEDNQFLNGDGVGKPQGILQSGANGGGLGEVNSGSNGAYTFDGIISLQYGIASQYRQKAVWISNRASYRDIRLLKDTEDNYLWPPYADNVAGQPSMLLGNTVLEQEVMPAIATNSFSMVFGDLGGYTIADRVGMSVERYLDSQTARQNMVYYIMRRRLGGQVTEPWRFNVQKLAT